MWRSHNIVPWYLYSSTSISSCLLEEVTTISFVFSTLHQSTNSWAGSGWSEERRHRPEEKQGRWSWGLRGCHWPVFSCAGSLWSNRLAAQAGGNEVSSTRMCLNHRYHLPEQLIHRIRYFLSNTTGQFVLLLDFQSPAHRFHWEHPIQSHLGARYAPSLALDTLYAHNCPSYFTLWVTFGIFSDSLYVADKYET